MLKIRGEFFDLGGSGDGRPGQLIRIESVDAIVNHEHPMTFVATMYAGIASVELTREELVQVQAALGIKFSNGGDGPLSGG